MATDHVAKHVGVAFACSRPDHIAMRGLVFCPAEQARHLAARMELLRRGLGSEIGPQAQRTGADWITSNFEQIGASNHAIELPSLGGKRRRTFCRVSTVAIFNDAFCLRLDVFVGPGIFDLTLNTEDESLAGQRSIHGFVDISQSASFEADFATYGREAMSGSAVLCHIEDTQDVITSDWKI